MPPLERQIVSWPLTGGLASKDSPLSQVPGTHIDLKNVRQERSDEWRTRYAYTRDALDDVPGGAAPARAVETSGGGAIGLTAEVGFAPAGLSYVPAGSSANRWNRCQAADCAQSTPSVWSRRPTMTADAQVATDYCEGSVYALSAAGGAVGASRGIVVALSSKADGTDISDPTGGVLLSTGVRPRCILGPSDRLCLVYIDTTNTAVLINTWNGATGANLGSVSLLGPGVTNAIHFLDAWWYGGTTITIVFRTNAGVIRFVEYDPMALSIATNVTLGNVDVALSLLPEPDASGVRFVALSDTGLNTLVKRVTSAGAVLTTDTVFVGTTPDITGVAYQAGAGWMVVYKGAAGGLNAVKKRSGVVSAVAALIPSPLPYGINSVAWREPGTDLMRFMGAIHGSSADPQDTYLELAIPFDTGATVSNLFPEPQARLLPLGAGPAVDGYAPGAIAHVQRVGTGQFVTGLCRLARFGRQPGAIANQYAVDRWTVTYQPAGGLVGANQGPGLATSDSTYLPAGSLLTTADGKRIVAHGLATVPLLPVLTPAVGGGALTTTQLYQYFSTVEIGDENGKTWRGPPSATAAVTLAGAQNQVSVAVAISAVELQGRIVTVKLWRTKGNGFVFQLVNVRTGTALALQSFTFLDQVADTALASADFYPGEAPATITPAFSHVTFWGGRMFGISRDFPTQLWFSKVVRSPFQPEFPGDVGFVVTFDDEFGDLTGLAALDDKLVLTKRRARYVVQGDGPDATGAGTFNVTRAGSDWGCIPGGVLVSTGTEVFSTTERGLYRMDSGLRDDYVGAGIDQWINQPSLAAVVPQQSIVGGIYVSTANEVRLLTANATSGQPKLFVYDRLRGLWFTDVGDGINAASIMRPLGTRVALFLSNGRMMFEGTSATTTDDGAAVDGVISSAWIRPAGNEGRLRLYRARLLGSQPTTGANTSPFFLIYRDNDDSLFEVFQPLAALSGTSKIIRAEARPRHRKCSSFRLLVTLPTGSTLRLDKWAVEFGLKPGVQNLPSSQRWRSP